MSRTRDLTALGAAVLACAAIVFVPAVSRYVVPPSGPTSPAVAAPKGGTFDLPGTVLSGMAYQPLVVVADGEAIGTAKGGDGSTISLVDVTSGAAGTTARVVQGGLNASSVSFDAFAVTADAVYFMRGDTTGGVPADSLWRLPRQGGSPARVLSHAGQLLVNGSIDDLQVAAGALRWIVQEPDDPSKTALVSMKLPAGPVSTRTLSDQYALTTYPMMYSGLNHDPATPMLTNSLTGQITQVHTIYPAGSRCDPVWCVLQSTDTTGAATVQLCRPDGTDLARLGDGTSNLVTADPTLAGRFVALYQGSSTGTAGANPTQALWLYDTQARRSVEIADGVAEAHGAGSWLWWSTGDASNVRWHILDLSTMD
jgi:hypothetical protein